jgi:hypothetical protein
MQKESSSCFPSKDASKVDDAYKFSWMVDVSIEIIKEYK